MKTARLKKVSPMLLGFFLFAGFFSSFAFQIFAYHEISLGVCFSAALLLCLCFLILEPPAVWEPKSFFGWLGGVALVWLGQETLWLHPRDIWLAIGLISMAIGSALLLWPLENSNKERKHISLSLKMEFVTFFILFLLGVFFRFWKLGQVPENVWFDEVNFGNTILDEIMRPGEAPVFLGGTVQSAGLYFHLGALFFKLFGTSVVSLRLLAAVFGSLSLVPFYFLARLWFGPVLGLAGLGIMACLRWGFIFQRIGFMVPLASFWMLTAFFFLWLALQRGGIWRWGLAGICLGISLHTYVPSRLLVPLVLIFFGWQAVRDRPDLRAFVITCLVVGSLGLLLFCLPLPAWVVSCAAAAGFGYLVYAGRTGKKFNFRFQEGAAFSLAYLLAAGPLIWFAIHHWEIFSQRASEVTIWSDIKAKGWSELWVSVERHLLMFHYEGDLNGRHNLFARPQLDFVTAALFFPAFGLMHLRAGRDGRAGFLCLWFWIMLAAAIFTIVVEAPQAHRAALLVPAIVLAILLLLENLGIFLKERVALASAKPIFATFLVIALALPVFNYYEYFYLWKQNDATWRSFSPNASVVARLMAKQPQGWKLLLSPLSKEYAFNGYEMAEFCRFFLRPLQRQTENLAASNLVHFDGGTAFAQGVLCVWGASDEDYTQAAKEEFPDLKIESETDPFTFKPLYLSLRVPAGRIPFLTPQELAYKHPFLYQMR